jgi:hypothetical protein
MVSKCIFVSQNSIAMRLLFLTIYASALLASCSTSTVKDKINQAGDAAGQVTGEFIEGAAKGIQKAFDVKVELPQNLQEKGVEFGKATVSSDSSGTDNLLVVYVIFNKDFKGELTAKVFDDQNQEFGRSRMVIVGKKGDASYIEFHFDKRTNIDSKNKIVVE